MTGMVRILCAVALLCLGFAHKAPVLAAPGGIPLNEIAAYVLPDGTLPVLCITSHDDGKSHPHEDGRGTGCEACRLNASVILPAPPAVVPAVVVRVRNTVLPKRFEAYHRQLYPPNTGPRAPPSGLIA